MTKLSTNIPLFKPHNTTCHVNYYIKTVDYTKYLRITIDGYLQWNYDIT